MEKDSSQKHIEALTAKHIKDIPQEMPSINFTDSVMDAILVNENVELYEYKPLISKKVWFVIFASIFGFILYAFTKSTEFNNVSTKYSQLFNYSLSDIVELPTISPIMGYACLILCFLILFQGLFLRNSINNILIK